MLCINLKPDFAITRRLLIWLEIERDVSQEYKNFSLGEMVILLTHREDLVVDMVWDRRVVSRKKGAE